LAELILTGKLSAELIKQISELIDAEVTPSCKRLIVCLMHNFGFDFFSVIQFVQSHKVSIHPLAHLPSEYHFTYNPQKLLERYIVPALDPIMDEIVTPKV
jgi:hypothetical protein